MKLVWSVLILIEMIGIVSCVTYLRPKNDKGPGTCIKCLNLRAIVTTNLIHFKGATRAGMHCIGHVERYFFKNEFSQQVNNIAVYHSKNMKSPAMEIEIEYLFDLHDRVLHQEEDEDR